MLTNAADLIAKLQLTNGSPIHCRCTYLVEGTAQPPLSAGALRGDGPLHFQTDHEYRSKLVALESQPNASALDRLET